MPQKLFFQHDFSARNDEKLLELRAEYGAEGYGVFWLLLELMAENDGALNNDKLKSISFSINVDFKTVQSIVDFCIESNLFSNIGTDLSSKRLDEHLDRISEKRKQQSLAGKRSAEKRKNRLLSNERSTDVQRTLQRNPTSVQPSIEEYSIVDDRIVENSIVEKSIEDGKTSLPTPKKKKALTLAEKQEKLNERAHKFALEIKMFSEEYDRDMLKAFYEWWIEPNRSKTKMKFEMNDTWDTGMRLATWNRKDFNNPQRKNSQPKSFAQSDAERARDDNHLLDCELDAKAKGTLTFNPQSREESVEVLTKLGYKVK